MKDKIHIVYGPTASGKTEYAIALAQNFDSVIINGDSMQIFREIPIITNQPTAHEMQGVPHVLFGYKSILIHSDISRWLEDAVKYIKNIRLKGKTPIITGGTGMYLRALIEGVSEIPTIAEEIRIGTRNLLAEIGAEKLHGLLAHKDPLTAEKLKTGDSQRITRAYEVIEATGISISEWNKKPHKKYFERDEFEMHFLDRERQEVYDRINKRFEKFLELGALDEAKRADKIFKDSGLLQNELDALPAYKAHGLRELIGYINGTLTLDEAIEKGQQVTRNYAKRQMTWYRNWVKRL